MGIQEGDFSCKRGQFVFMFLHPAISITFFKDSDCLVQVSLAFDRSPLEWKKLSDRGQKKDYFNSWK
jgi:hypothetical protein